MHQYINFLAEQGGCACPEPGRAVSSAHESSTATTCSGARTSSVLGAACTEGGRKYSTRSPDSSLQALPLSCQGDPAVLAEPQRRSASLRSHTDGARTTRIKPRAQRTGAGGVHRGGGSAHKYPTRKPGLVDSSPHASRLEASGSPLTEPRHGVGGGEKVPQSLQSRPHRAPRCPPQKKRTAPRALRERRVFLATRGSSHSRLQWQPRARKRKKCTENESIRKGTYTARRSSHQETITASTPRIVHTRCGPILAQESTRKHKKANTDTNTNLNRNQDFPAAVAAAPARSLPVVPRPVRRHAPLDDCARRAEARGLVAGVAQQQRDDAVRGHGRGREVAHRGAVVGVRPEVLGGRASCQASGVERWVERRMSARGERRYTTRAAGRTRTLYCLPARIHGDSVRLNVMSAGSSSTFSCGRGAARQ